MLNQSGRKTLGCGESTKVEKEYMRMEKILRLPLKNFKKSCLYSKRTTNYDSVSSITRTTDSPQANAVHFHIT